jgi:hypothetical protein
MIEPIDRSGTLRQRKYFDKLHRAEVVTYSLGILGICSLERAKIVQIERFSFAQIRTINAQMRNSRDGRPGIRCLPAYNLEWRKQNCGKCCEVCLLHFESLHGTFYCDRLTSLVRFPDKAAAGPPSFDIEENLSFFCESQNIFANFPP